MWTYIQIGIAAVLVTAQLFGLWMAVDVAMKGRTGQGAVAWALALLFLPIVSLPLYLVFGERKFEGYVRARRRGTRGIDKIAKELSEKLRPLCPPLREAYVAYAAPERLARFPFTTGNRVELLVDGKATFEAIFRAIEGARDYLLVQFYIIRDDEL